MPCSSERLRISIDWAQAAVQLEVFSSRPLARASVSIAHDGI